MPGSDPRILWNYVLFLILNMSKAKKILLVIGIILGLIIVLIIIGYYSTVGFTKKQQYEKCSEVCRQMMIYEADIPMCKMKCEQVSGYKPPSKQKKAVETKKSSGKIETTSEKSVVIEQKKLIGDYYCDWVWPQKIIKKSTNEEVYRCPEERPWCDYADGTYEKVGCCKKYDGETKTKTDCVTLPTLQNPT